MSRQFRNSSRRVQSPNQSLRNQTISYQIHPICRSINLHSKRFWFPAKITDMASVSSHLRCFLCKTNAIIAVLGNLTGREINLWLENWPWVLMEKRFFIEAFSLWRSLIRNCRWCDSMLLRIESVFNAIVWLRVLFLLISLARGARSVIWVLAGKLGSAGLECGLLGLNHCQIMYFEHGALPYGSRTCGITPTECSISFQTKFAQIWDLSTAIITAV